MFEGFPRDTPVYLRQLGENNRKDWFEDHREDYQRCIQEPLKALVSALGPHMLGIDPLMEISAKRSISRIHRDVRFSYDKSPYRNHVWVSFKRLSIDWKVEPTYFFEIMPNGYRYGMGFYNAPREVMNEIRTMIDVQDPKFMKVHKVYRSQNLFVMEGERYKRQRRQDLSHDLAEWYQRKELYFTANRSDDLLFRTDLLDTLVSGFHVLEPLYSFLIGVKEKIR